jgi:hypothetical protein
MNLWWMARFTDALGLSGGLGRTETARLALADGSPTDHLQLTTGGKGRKAGPTA